MKMMFQTLVDCEPNLLERIEDECKRREPIDIKEALSCFTTDVIGSCAFGLDCKTFKEENSPFRVYGKKVFTATKSRIIKMMIGVNFPKLARSLHITTTPEGVSEFFFKVVKDTVDYREKNNYTRKDFMQLLIDLKNNKIAEEEGYQHDGKTLTIEEVAAQSYVFFIAGFETSSTAMTFALYELGRRQDLQQKVRDEIETVLAKHQGKITYEAIQDMKYMDQVINETLRKYPPVPDLVRKCVKDYKVPDSDLVIEKGTKVIIPVLGIHYDKEYFPDPEKFDPERFTEENKNSRHSYAHIPFGEGPRMCIGMRFGLLQSKVGLTVLLRKYKFTVNNKTKEPLKMSVRSVVLAAAGVTAPKDISEFFMKNIRISFQNILVKDIIKYREENNCTRKDFVQLLIDLKNNKITQEEGYQHDGKTLTIEEIAAQSFVFFIAGFETFSTTMTFALYELARRQVLQQKVRDEIGAVLAKHQEKITYEVIQDMKYMDQAINVDTQTFKMFLTESFCADLIGLGVAFLAIIIARYKWNFQYWKRKNLPYLEPSIPFGNSQNPFKRKEPNAVTIKRNYDVMKANGWKHGGIYFMTTPIYMVIDLDYVKNVITKDFQYFVDRGVYYNEKDDPLSA
ncbi:p450 domain containing protein, partial [Asbolus verrucosus]